MIDAGKICAVIITWNAGSEFINNIDAVLPQVGRVIIIDNGSEIATRLMLDGIRKQSPEKIDLILQWDLIKIALFETSKKKIKICFKRAISRSLPGG